MPVHAGPVTGVAIGPKNDQVLTVGNDGMMKLWAMPPVAARALAHPEAVLAAALSPDSQRLYTGSADKIVRVWNVASNAVERQFAGHTAPVTTVAPSSNGQLLSSAGADQTVRISDQASGKEKAIIGAHAMPITSLAANAAGTHLISAGQDGAVKFWKLPEAPRTFPHPDQVTCVAVSHDAKLLTGCVDKQVRLINLANGNVDHAFPGNTLAIGAVAFNDALTQIAAGRADKSLTVWNVADKKELKKIPSLPAAVQAVALRWQVRRLRRLLRSLALITS